MDWAQVGQVASIVLPLLIALYTFYRDIKADMKEISRIHREDITLMDAKIDKMDAKFTNALEKMDSKWERLFTMFLTLQNPNLKLQDAKNNSAS